MLDIWLYIFAHCYQRIQQEGLRYLLVAKIAFT